MMFSGLKKGQGATEYLVLLAVVLIVAMVAIVLLGFFPGLAVDAKISQSDSYWRGSIRPFAVLQHAMPSSTGVLTLVIQNKEGSQRVLKRIDVSGSGLTGSLNVSNVSAQSSYFSAGEQRTFQINMSGNCTRGNSYEFDLSFDYEDSKGLLQQVQIGEKPLVGKCS